MPLIKEDYNMPAKPVVIKFFAPVIDVTNLMLERTTLNPDEAKAWGLVHEVKSELFEAGSEVISIQYHQKQGQ